MVQGKQQLMADLWYQTAGETKALYYQGYNIGQLKLDAILAKGTEKKPAIVLDLAFACFYAHCLMRTVI